MTRYCKKHQITYIFRQWLWYGKRSYYTDRKCKSLKYGKLVHTYLGTPYDIRISMNNSRLLGHNSCHLIIFKNRSIKLENPGSFSLSSHMVKKYFTCKKWEF